MKRRVRFVMVLWVSAGLDVGLLGGCTPQSADDVARRGGGDREDGADAAAEGSRDPMSSKPDLELDSPPSGAQGGGGAAPDGRGPGDSGGATGDVPGSDPTLDDEPEPPVGSAGTNGVGTEDPIGPRSASVGACPSAEPAGETDCGADNRWCTYGEAALFECRPTYYCSDGGWREQDETGCILEGYCPSIAPADGDPCVIEAGPLGFGNAACAYADAFCLCVGLESGPIWSCQTIMNDTQCPALAPNLGQPCVTQGLGCQYGDRCKGGADMVCRLGYWTLLEGACAE